MQTSCVTSILFSGSWHLGTRSRGAGSLVTWIVLTVSFWLAAPVGAQDSPIRYRLDSGSSVGEPVMVEVTLVNEGSGELAIDLGALNMTRFVFDVTSPDGTRARPPRPLPPDGFHTVGRFRLDPGETTIVFIALSDLFAFRHEGAYVVDLTYDGTVMRQGTSVQVQRQARWEFTLGPKNLPALRRRCDGWLTTILSPLRGPGHPDHQAAVKALTSVRDGVAVPYLLRSAEARGLAIEEVEALEKIGGSEARLALETLANSPNFWTASIARSALLRIK
jgi:hypothetical protein